LQNLPSTDSADFDEDGDVDGADFLAWQRGFGTQTPNATPEDGDADNDQDVDADDLGIWENQFGQPATVIASATSSIVETRNEAEPGATTQLEIPAALNSSPTKLVADQFPTNFILRTSDFGLGLNTISPRQVLKRATVFTEHIDQAFDDTRDSFEQQNDFTNDGTVHAKLARRVQVTQSVDKAFAMLLDDEGFAGLRLQL